MRGIVEVDGARVSLLGPNGERDRLLVPQSQEAVRALAGVEVDMDVVRLARGARVTSWWVTEGPHGLQAVTGLLVRDGARVAVFDRATRVWFFLETADARQLAPHVGREVLLEGYQQGERTFQVVHYRLLTPEPAPNP